MGYVGDMLGISLSERTSGVPPVIFSLSPSCLLFGFQVLHPLSFLATDKTCLHLWSGLFSPEQTPIFLLRLQHYLLLLLFNHLLFSFALIVKAVTNLTEVKSTQLRFKYALYLVIVLQAKLGWHDDSYHGERTSNVESRR